jgi:DNA gyrase/topoisomerase IV subunit B
MTPAQFFAAYDVSSTEQPLYLSSSGELNDNAVYLAYYKGLGQSERQQLQNQMVDVGALSATDANGLDNSTATSAFEGLIGQTAAQGTNVIQYLSQNATGTAGIQNQISAGLTKAQEAATQPIVATVENPTTLSATLTAAFENALGYSPDQAQISSFINQVQNQDTTYASAPRAEAQQEIDQAHSEESALNKLGPDGIDSVIQAYQAAVRGRNFQELGRQGPQNGQRRDRRT